MRVRAVGIALLCVSGVAGSTVAEGPAQKLEVVSPKPREIIAAGIIERGDVIGFEWVEEKERPGVVEQNAYRVRACVWDRDADGKTWNSTPLPQKEQLGSNTVALSANGQYAAAVILSSGASAAPQDARPAAPATQISAYVRVIFEDRAGNLWFGTNDDGVCRYDGKTFADFTTKDGFGGKAVRGIAQDPDGNLWFATDGGISRYDGKSFTTFKVKDGLPDDDAWSILVDRKGTVWVGTLAGVCRFNGNAFVRFPLPAAHAEGIPRLSRELAWSLFEDRAGNLWFGLDGVGVRKYNGATFETYTAKDGLASDNVRCILQDRAGNLWFGTWGGGVSRFDGKAFVTFTERQGLASNDVWTMLEAKDGNLWFGTVGGGASRYNGKALVTFKETAGLTRNHVQSIFQDRVGTLWFGFSGGAFRFDGKSFVNFSRNTSK